ncbi:hypothetical protein [Variovorax paradoxus]|uniref:hypothetical protein n=1 Tax=Variovorax paradoxus TaxID=34073 RepID=UPI00247FD5B4|nr:hypothetical protein [Variovorax paradoxus]WGT66014.1 hypothetical protein QHG62_11955 [Variovorax paradoxus]
MAKLIALPDGSTGSFPDDMDDGAITAVLRKQFPPKEPAPNPADGMTATERFVTGVGGAAARLRDKIFPPGSPIDAMTFSHTGDNGRARKADLATYEANKEALGTAGKVGEITGEVAATAIPIGRAASLGGKVLAKTLGRMAPASADIATNAGYAAATAEPDERGTAALVGGAGAAGGRVLTRALGGLARPFVSKEAQALIDAGVRPTPGQLFGDGPIGSLVRSAEDKITSIPLVGDVVQHARRRSLSEYGNAEINAALKPLGEKVAGSGAEAVEQASKVVSDYYDRVLPQTFIPPQGVVQAVKSVRSSIDEIPLITDEQKGHVIKYVAQKITPAVNEAAQRGGPISGETAKAIDAEIGHYARKFTSSVNPSDHPLGEAFYELQASLRGALEGTTPEAIRTLSATNAAYRQMLPVLKAADRTTSGQFTPRQLNRASGQYNQRPSELNLAGQKVLPNTVPDSGTAGRALLGGSLLGGGAALTGQALPAAAAAALYSGPGMSFLVNGLRGVVPDKVISHIASLPPAGQRTALEQLAAQIPAVGARLRELVPQVGRALATQNNSTQEAQ